MRKVVDYHILTADSPEALIALVNADLGDLGDLDWQPFGGVSVSLSESDDYRYIVFAQAMVRYEGDPQSEG